MRILRNIIITLLLMALLAISVAGAMIELPRIYKYEPTRINQLGHSFLDVMRPGHMMFWTWLGLALACILVFLMTILRPRKQMKIEVQMGGGRVVIMDSAIKRYIRSALAELQGVVVRRIDLRETRLGVSTDLYADVRTHGNLPILERQIIQRVRAALAEDLGITSIGEVHVFIRDFEVADRAHGQPVIRRPQPREEETEPEPARPFKASPEEAAAKAPEYTKPIASTGPFDQVPMPAPRAAAAAPTAITEPSPSMVGSTADDDQPGFTPYRPIAEEPKETYFTPAPTAAATSPQPTTDLGPKDIYALSEAAHNLDDNKSESAGDATEARVTDIAAPAEKPRKRGLFGMFGGSSPQDNAGAVQTDQKVEYNPATATESADAPADTAEPAEPNADKTEASAVSTDASENRPS